MSLTPYIHGCNYPWSTDGETVFYGLDFGDNVWGSHVGVSTRRAAVASDFAEMAALGFTAARWFVFCDGRSGIVFDERGLPAGLDSHFFLDLDAGLEIARDAGIRLDLVLLDFSWMFAGLRETIADPASGVMHEARLPEGRARVLLVEPARARLYDRVFAPLVRRYGRSGERADLAPAILAYELMNEPDFVVEEWERDLSSRAPRPLPFELLAGLISQLSALVHAEAPGTMATLGGARLHNLWAWDDPALGLDVLQIHSYPDTRHPRREADIFGTPAAALGVRRAVILGEFPANGPAQHPERASPPGHTLDDYLDFAVSGGYAGAWPWSFSGTDAYGRVPREPLMRFAARHPDLVNTRVRHE